MNYVEILIADGHYKADKPLTYASETKLPPRSVVSVPLRGRSVNGFVLKSVTKPNFKTMPVKSLLSEVPLPAHTVKLAEWIAHYYHTGLGDALRQFAPSIPTVRRPAEVAVPVEDAALPLDFRSPLTDDQRRAIATINRSRSHTLLLHGATGSGKTRVYLELAQAALANDKSAILLTPEIALTTQLAHAAAQLSSNVLVIHSQLATAERKKLWLNILEATEPVVVIGPRSALFAPVKDLGLVVLDEAHEPAYKQEQVPRYHAARVASTLATLTGGKAILGTATPSVTDYYVAEVHKSVVKMTQPALPQLHGEVKTELVDIKNRANFSRSQHLSDQLIKTVQETSAAGLQSLIYLNRRGSARLVMCEVCGWQLLCPNCDLPLVYHSDKHNARCHTCGFTAQPPGNCPSCGSPDIIYKSAGTKAIAQSVAKIFPQLKVHRFDSDSSLEESLHSVYDQLRAGEIDVLVGTQLLAKGLDLPKLGLVGIVIAETSLSLPDYTAEERTFQLLYQVMGRVGRGHNPGRVVIQSYDPKAPVITAAIAKDWDLFYKTTLTERRQFRFPPFSYLLKLTARRATAKGAETAARHLRELLVAQKLPVEIIGPTPSFYGWRGNFYYWQLVVKSKNREHLLKLTDVVPSGWTIDLDPPNLL